MAPFRVSYRNAVVPTEACKRTKQAPSPQGLSTDEGNTNCQANELDAEGYFRASASGSGARPAPRIRSRDLQLLPVLTSDKVRPGLHDQHPIVSSWCTTSTCVMPTILSS
jgi:hypothetical protein